MAITLSERTEFTATHLAPAVKEQLRRVAQQRQQSMSEFIAQAVKEKLLRHERWVQKLGKAETS